MEYQQRKHPRLKAYDYSGNGAYFITICTRQREPLLGSIRTDGRLREEADLGMGQIELSAVGQICKQFLEGIPEHYTGVFLDCYIIMPDHIHLLLVLDDAACSGGQGSDRPTVQRILHAFKRLSSQQADRKLWQESFYEHIVRNETDLHEIRQYILQNPIKRSLERSGPLDSRRAAYHENP